MTISYNWLSEYLPEKIEPDKLSKILTSIGLEVESLEKYEEIKGGLEGIVIGKIAECEKHPDADKLSITKVKINAAEPLQIICGAPNVAVGQKVLVATIGTTLYPTKGEPIVIKKAKIRGVESYGMICAADEIGLSDDHAGIIVLPSDAHIGMPAADYYKPYIDFIFEIGLTPNRMDAMSHLGVARDVCAYLSHHNKRNAVVKAPFKNNFKPDILHPPIDIVIENTDACQRYAGIGIQGITVAPSPLWLRQKLKSIGLKPINNIVDITNFVLHETGQPLHAFDADTIQGNKIIVQNVPEGTAFITLDEKQRRVSSEDLMICNAAEPMCIAGILGGLHSGVSEATKNVFLESAWFNSTTIRKTSLRFGLRTDAAARFEKGVDIGATVQVLKRAAILIREIAGGEIVTDVIDIYPKPKEKTEVALKYHYLKKISGKNYHSDTVKNILSSLGFDLIKEGLDEMRFAVPFSKPDVTLAADIVEEIMRIDGLDNVEIPSSITISPSAESNFYETALKEKISNYLAASGLSEIVTNSITNSAYFDEATLQTTVKMLNSLSSTLNVLRPGMVESGLEVVAYNLNRKKSDVQLFEFGKTYAINEAGNYTEKKQLTLYISGKRNADSWQQKSEQADFFYLKAIVEKINASAGIETTEYIAGTNDKLDNYIEIKVKKETIATIGNVNKKMLHLFDIKQPVWIAAIEWEKFSSLAKKIKIQFNEIIKYPSVQRDLSIVVDKKLKFEEIEKSTKNAKASKLQSIHLFDIFESAQLGEEKKSMAIRFTFTDEEKTMTDKDIDAQMNKIIASYQKEINAEIRK